MQPLGPAALDEVLAGLLRASPPGHVAAIDQNGLFVPLPPSLPLDGHPPIGTASSALDLVVPDDIQAVIRTWTSARTSGAAHERVRLLAAPDTLVEIHFVDARHSHGVYLGMVLGAPEVSGTRTPAEGALRPRYGTNRKDELGVFIECDDSYLQMLGRTAGDLVGRRGLEIIHPDDQTRAIANWMDQLRSPGAARRTRLRHRRGDGSWMWLEVTNHNLLGLPEDGHVLGEAIDISEEMVAAEALRAGEELLRRLTDALPVGVVQLDAAGRVVYRNDPLQEVLGVPVSRGDDLLAAFAAGGDAAGTLRPVLRAALDRGVDGDHEVRLAPSGRARSRRVLVAVRALHATAETATAGDVTGAVACVSDVTEAAALREELTFRATVDALTGCLTRRALLDRLDELLAGSVPVTALFLDLDGFKRVNDRFGHATGDRLLQHVGARLLAHVGEQAHVGRVGGDEFIVVTTAPRDDAAAARTADGLLRAVGEPLVIDGISLAARASVGVARAAPGTDADALVAAADQLMYRDKSSRSVPAG